MSKWVKKINLNAGKCVQIPVVSDVPGVGRNLHDHIAAYGLTWTTQSAGLGYNPFLYTLNPRTYFDWKMYKVQIQDFNSFHFLKSGSIWFNLLLSGLKYG